MYKSSFFFYVLNHYIVDIERPDEICSLTLVVDDFQNCFYIHQTFLSKIEDLHK